MKILLFLFVSTAVWGFVKEENHIDKNIINFESTDSKDYPKDDWDLELEKDEIISFEELNETFERIAEVYNLPAALLKVVSANETGWVANFNSRNSYGIMGLNYELVGEDYRDYEFNIDKFSQIISDIRDNFQEVKTIEDYYPILVKYYQNKYNDIALTTYIKEDVKQFYKDISNGYTLTDAENNKINIPSIKIDLNKLTSYQKFDYSSASWVSKNVHHDHYRVSNRRASQITHIVVHITAGSTLAGAVNWWHKSKAQRGGSVGSAHYIVARNGKVYQAVHDKDIAYHAKGFNNQSIGIEHVGTVRMGYTETIYKGSAKLSRWLCNKYNISKRHTSKNGGSGILGHNETGSPKACPGPFDYDHYINLVRGGSNDYQDGDGNQGENGNGNGCSSSLTKTTNSSFLFVFATLVIFYFRKRKIQK